MKTATKRTATKRTAVEVAAAIAELFMGLSDEQAEGVCEQAMEMVRARREAVRLRRSYAKLRGEFGSFGDFAKDCVDIGEWHPSWGELTEHD